MKFTFAVETQEEFKAYNAFAERHATFFQSYLKRLKEEFEVAELPEVVVLANLEMATKVFRDIKIPAYTNDVRMVVTPEPAVWKEIYLKQLECYESDNRTDFVYQHYSDLMDEQFILQIIGHEFVHWSELFLDDFDDTDTREEGIWFEEGMAEYISRKLFFTEEIFESEKVSNQILVELFEEKNGRNSLEAFGQSTYDGSYASIFYEYWRSFLMIDKLVQDLGSLKKVFTKYHDWDRASRPTSLAEWFGLE